jgi:hypothetical protein
MQIGVVVGFLFGIALVLLVLLPRSAQLKKIFSNDHLIEIAEQMEVGKPLAVSLADVAEEKFALEDDPRTFVTSAGIVIYYTISRNENLYLHHFSLTDQYGITAHAVGATLVVYIGLLLNIPPDILTVERSEQQVFHASFDLTEAEQAMFVASPLQTPTLAKVRAMLEECREARHTLVVHSI